MPENSYHDQNSLFLDDAQAGESMSLGRYTAKTFALMFLGLLVTFAVAFFLGNTVQGRILVIRALMAMPYLHLIILVAELAVVIGMSAMLRKLSPAAATVCFFTYAVLTGLTFSLIFIAYDLSTLTLIFGFTALYFGGMAVFGYLTRIDLSRLRPILLGGLIVLIVMNVLMLFIPGLAAMDRVLCTVGVVIFLGFTAYDTQKIKSYYYSLQGDGAMLKKAGVISALELYLDFINLFLYLLRIFGRSRD